MLVQDSMHKSKIHIPCIALGLSVWCPQLRDLTLLMHASLADTYVTFASVQHGTADTMLATINTCHALSCAASHCCWRWSPDDTAISTC